MIISSVGRDTLGWAGIQQVGAVPKNWDCGFLSVARASRSAQAIAQRTRIMRHAHYCRIHLDAHRTRASVS